MTTEMSNWKLWCLILTKYKALMNATDLEKIELPSSVSGSVLKEIMKAILVLSAFVSIADNYFHDIQYNNLVEDNVLP